MLRAIVAAAALLAGCSGPASAPSVSTFDLRTGNEAALEKLELGTRLTVVGPVVQFGDDYIHLRHRGGLIATCGLRKGARPPAVEVGQTVRITGTFAGYVPTSQVDLFACDEIRVEAD